MTTLPVVVFVELSPPAALVVELTSTAALVVELTPMMALELTPVCCTGWDSCIAVLRGSVMTETAVLPCIAVNDRDSCIPELRVLL